MSKHTQFIRIREFCFNLVVRLLSYPKSTNLTRGLVLVSRIQQTNYSLMQVHVCQLIHQHTSANNLLTEPMNWCQNVCLIYWSEIALVETPASQSPLPNKSRVLWTHNHLKRESVLWWKTKKISISTFHVILFCYSSFFNLLEV